MVCKPCWGLSLFFPLRMISVGSEVLYFPFLCSLLILNKIPVPKCHFNHNTSLHGREHNLLVLHQRQLQCHLVGFKVLTQWFSYHIPLSCSFLLPSTQANIPMVHFKQHAGWWPRGHYTFSIRIRFWENINVLFSFASSGSWASP